MADGKGTPIKIVEMWPVEKRKNDHISMYICKKNIFRDGITSHTPTPTPLTALTPKPIFP